MGGGLYVCVCGWVEAREGVSTVYVERAIWESEYTVHMCGSYE